MEFPAELRGFLTTRRARLTPDQAGVPQFPGVRRVPGLRREEVAHLAGVSVDYYTRLERGRVAGASREVLEAVARALRLGEDEHDHFLSLVAAIQQTRPGRPAGKPGVRPELRRVLDALSTPAFIQNDRLDFLYANRLGRAVFSLSTDEPAPGETFNTLRFQLLDPRARDFYLDWEGATHNGVAVLRASAGRDPGDPDIARLVDELSGRSEYFRTLWASHDVLRYRRGAKRYRHPVAGELTFDYESFRVNDDPALTMLVYTAEPGSGTAHALSVL
ncbi:helix-turn-helix transcriptional regulator [Paractinoplanes atraurantiacus]|uniref:Helix-turn-helix domain-containing protein n=1 Tax=Paractinoplanes atraurantiacus TaxID=1036182 RepID=A0A285K0R3_9ACTN|nr:helix-turn-helix transcriptional regulator [Actinoplanes atraurantiacus]SNY64901.1 Helix-turn-helix domain-containing protein [Actinoplanes atraurantiacus]